MKTKGMSEISGVLVGVLVALVSVFVSAPQLVAQTVTGRILGTIRDQQGAVVPDASVSAANLDTGAQRTVLSGVSGGYNIVSVPAGVYEVRASAPGFRTEVRSGVTLTVGASLRVDFTLQLGAVAEIVEVTGEIPQVDTTTSAMGGVINETTIEELPLNARDWLQLPLLQSGVVSPMGGTRSTGRGYGQRMSVSGGRVSQNVYRMDGLVMNDHTNNTPGSILGVSLGVDAIREFSVLTTSYSAEYGRGSGGVINAITKSGTNSLHGTGFYFHRNSRLDEKEFFDRVDEPIPPFRRHQFGASLGGPVVRDKLFFFTNYEGLRQFLSVSLAANTFSPNVHNGIICADRACTRTTTVEIDPRVRPYLALYPLSNGPITGDTGRFFKGAGIVGREDYGISRIDYLLSDNTTLTGQYTIDDASNGDPGDLGIDLTRTRTLNQRAVLTLQHVFSPTVLNIIRGGVNRVNGSGVVETLIPGLTDPALGFLPGQFVGLINVTGVENLQGPEVSLPDTFVFTSLQLYDDLAWVKGRHNIRIGFGVEAVRNHGHAPPNFAGQWRFGSIRDFLTVNPRSFNGVLPGGTRYLALRTKVFGTYFQDDFRLSPTLTLNLGLRYEPQTAVSDVNGRISTLLNLTDTEPNIRSKIYENPSLRNFAPRVGFAWDPFGTGSTAVRGGFGKYDILALPNLFLQRLVSMYPFSVQAAANNPPASSFPNQIVDLLSPADINSTYVEPTPSSSYKLQWNLNIQRQIAGGLSLTAGYVGSKAVHLSNNAGDINMVPPHLTRFEDGHLRFPEPRAPKINPLWSRIVLVRWDGYSTYHGLQVNVSKQMSRGFSMQANYSWSKSMDVGSQEIANGGELATASENPYPFIPALFRGLSDYDIPHRLSVNFLWDVPSPNSSRFVSRVLLSGWELSGIFQAQAGSPFSLRIDEEVAGTGATAGRFGTGQRPDFVVGAGCSSPGDAVIPVNNASPGRNIQYVKLECFRYPKRFTWGNLGRNTLRGPGLVNFDFSLSKNHSLLDEKLRVQFRAEFFNLFNRSNFGISSLTGFNSQGEGVPSQVTLSSTATRARQIQLGTKLIW